MISVLTPVHETDPGLLRACIESVRRQTYSNWQLCLVDDGSRAAHVGPMLQAAAAADPRIRTGALPTNQGIAAATNQALELASGEFVAFLDHDDELYPEALARAAALLAADPEVDFLYTDEDLIAADGRRVRGFHKPGWSPERLRSQMYTAHLAVMRRSLVEAVGGLRPGFDGSQDYDLALRVSERARRVAHLPEILYSWRLAPASVATSETAKPMAYPAARRAIQEHLARTGQSGRVEPGRVPGIYRIEDRALPGSVSVVLPYAGARTRVLGVERAALAVTLDALAGIPAGIGFELLVPGAETPPGEVTRRLASIPSARWLPATGGWSALAAAGAEAAVGEVLALLVEGDQPVTAGWLARLAGLAAGGVVAGPRLLEPDGRIRSAGYVKDRGRAAPMFAGYPGGHDGAFRNLWLEAECLAVAASGLTVPAELGRRLLARLRTVSGEPGLALSLAATEAGVRVVHTPHAALRRWLDSPPPEPVAAPDPYYQDSAFLAGADHREPLTPRQRPVWRH